MNKLKSCNNCKWFQISYGASKNHKKPHNLGHTCHLKDSIKKVYSNHLEHVYKHRVREAILFASEYSNIDIRVLKDILNKPLFEFDVKEIK